jgi:hypothetical protein
MDALTPQAVLAAIPPEPPKPITHDVTATWALAAAQTASHQRDYLIEAVRELSLTAGAKRQREYRARQGDVHRNKHRDEMREWRANNPEKSNEAARAYRARNPDQVRSSNLKKLYGITLDQFNDLFRAQGEQCAICKATSSTGKNWHVDHCHEAGRIRGILCHSCNLMIGHASDDVERLLAAVEYLK